MNSNTVYLISAIASLIGSCAALIASIIVYRNVKRNYKIAQESSGRARTSLDNIRQHRERLEQYIQNAQVNDPVVAEAMDAASHTTGSFAHSVDEQNAASSCEDTDAALGDADGLYQFNDLDEVIRRLVPVSPTPMSIDTAFRRWQTQVAQVSFIRMNRRQILRSTCQHRLLYTLTGLDRAIRTSIVMNTEVNFDEEGPRLHEVADRNRQECQSLIDHEFGEQERYYNSIVEQRLPLTTTTTQIRNAFRNMRRAVTGVLTDNEQTAADPYDFHMTLLNEMLNAVLDRINREHLSDSVQARRLEVLNQCITEEHRYIRRQYPVSRVSDEADHQMQLLAEAIKNWSPNAPHSESHLTKMQWMSSSSHSSQQHPHNRSS